ncbi:hypothetical protein ACRE_043480 [Hapsidospora chrysogenum ATCC 11550]|uniref:Zn(2)-C6 fungal-type domain-containing protein n=1 Tax=Hapsidospora chrysogenum (strain ATCC 11550 / CBS 779.69 / DSM 880 / IAM 14645 / JCM 23072 / IMI 49137) TaxID=857340 RepID=A0A086T670_HAPC1|nr:hypothetical protein ACRE_043480 [Hapsidospora chrysogenum ATCC 11550]
MPSRRPHTNSHHGCLQCKARRVKCDQLQPKCSRCEKRASECTYRHLMTSYNPFQQGQQTASWTTTSVTFVPPETQNSNSPGHRTPSSSRSTGTRTPNPTSNFIPTPRTSTPATVASTPAPPAILPSSFPTSLQPSRALSPAPSSLPVFDPSDNFLFHHYATNLTVPRMSPIRGSRLFNTLNAAVLRHAASVPYVHHVVLSFSALHLASTHASASHNSPGSGANHYSFLSAALTHKDKALQLFLAAIRAGVTAASAEPLIAASTVLMACEFALPAADPTRRTAFDRVDILAHVAGLFQGTAHLSNHSGRPRDASYSSSTSSASGSETSSPPPAVPWPGDDVPWPQAQDSVRRVVVAIEALSAPENKQDETRRTVLRDAATSLIETFSLISTGQRDSHSLCAWLGAVRKEFVEFLRAKDQLAMVLLAHWATCHTNMESTWWKRGWPSATVTSIDEALDQEHKPLLEWCLGQVTGTLENVGSFPS